MVGTIIKAEKSISFLQPVFDCHSLIAADIISSEKSLGGISGLIQGEYGTSMKMRYVPWDKQIKAGDVVITSGLQEKIRRGLVIGEIAEISKKPNAVFQEVIVRPLKSFQDLRIVSVLIR